MSAAHTPGPWRVNSMTRIEAPDFGLIASVRGDLIEPTTTGNTRLIAAAPDLLEALEGVTRTLEAFAYTTQLGRSQTERLEKARAVIAKARGATCGRPQAEDEE